MTICKRRLYTMQNEFDLLSSESMIVHSVGRNAKHIVHVWTSGFEEMILVTIYAASVPASTMFSFITSSAVSMIAMDGDCSEMVVC